MNISKDTCSKCDIKILCDSLKRSLYYYEKKLDYAIKIRDNDYDIQFILFEALL